MPQMKPILWINIMFTIIIILISTMTILHFSSYYVKEKSEFHSLMSSSETLISWKWKW